MFSHLLDRPVWNALATGWASLSQGDDRARRLHPDYGPFGAAADQEDQGLLAALIPAGGEIWMVERDGIRPPPGVQILRQARLVQMVAHDIVGDTALTPAILTDADGAEMRALALLTRPGPFGPLTHRFGGFIGAREEGRLIAMAGTRMRLPGYREVSGVCTHPDHRGRGHAKALMRIVARTLLSAGDTPFLHAYADHHPTVEMYRTLGFRVRAEMDMMVIGPAPDA